MEKQVIIVSSQPFFWDIRKLLKSIQLNKNQNGCSNASAKLDFYNNLSLLFRKPPLRPSYPFVSETQYHPKDMTKKARSLYGSSQNQLDPVFPYKTPPTPSYRRACSFWRPVSFASFACQSKKAIIPLSPKLCLHFGSKAQRSVFDNNQSSSHSS